MPQSMKAIPPSGVRNRLPGCGVGMEKMEFEALPKDGVRPEGDDLAAVVLVEFFEMDPGEQHPVNLLDRQDVFGPSRSNKLGET